MPNEKRKRFVRVDVNEATLGTAPTANTAN
jgi:hypothetical protein